MPSPTLNRLLWVLVIALIGVFAMRAQDVINITQAAIGKLDVRSDPQRSTLFLRWRGKIQAPMLQKLTEALNDKGNDATRIVLSLSSTGGALDHGAEVIRFLQSLRERYRLETFVEGRGICASMCVPVYLQGDVRTAAPDARFMFHEVSFRESLSDDSLEVPSKAVEKATDRFFAKYLETAGVSRDWLVEIRRAITGGSEVWKTGRELVSDNAGIVQSLKE